MVTSSTVTKLKIKEKNRLVLPIEELVVDYRTRAWCKLPYPGHPEGCPNFGKKEICPPRAPLIEQVIKPPFFLVGVKFNLKKHTERMKRKHPDWSKRKARCLLYWQKKVNKRLRELSEKVSSNIPDSKIVYIPEATGVDVFETCRKNGLTLDKNPDEIVWKIAIIGKKRSCKNSKI